MLKRSIAGRPVPCFVARPRRFGWAPVLSVGDDLGVAAADVEDDGIGGARHDAAHLDVGHAVVDADQWLAPELRARARICTSDPR